MEMRELVRKVPLARQIQDYAVRVVLATHPENPEATPRVKQFMRYGASPRGLQAVILAAKIRALLEGRYAVAIDDIRHVAPRSAAPSDDPELRRRGRRRQGRRDHRRDPESDEGNLVVAAAKPDAPKNEPSGGSLALCSTSGS